MSKRKLRTTGLVLNGLLLITAVISVSATHRTANSSYSVISDTTVQQLSFDTTFLKLNGLSETNGLDVPAITLNKQAKEFVTGYVAKNNDLLAKIKEKSARSFAVIDAVFTQYNLPTELKYLAVIESELKSKALSRVGARGYWQLMPGTARILSLKVSKKYDERTHLYKSTVAAAKYLRDLYKMFGDWTLVIAAYNSGPGKVLSAIKKSGSRNFWKLQYHLPAETRGHVKKFIGTHYYFEGKGSVTTLTRQEVVAYRKTMEAFVVQYNALQKEKQEVIADTTDILEKESLANTNSTAVLKQAVEK